MKITIKPIAMLPGGAETQVSVSGDRITWDGMPYDLSAVPEGGEATPQGDHPFAEPITREAGEIACTVKVFFDPATAEPNKPTDPAYWTVTVASGVVPDMIPRKQE